MDSHKFLIYTYLVSFTAIILTKITLLKYPRNILILIYHPINLYRFLNNLIQHNIILPHHILIVRLKTHTLGQVRTNVRELLYIRQSSIISTCSSYHISEIIAPTTFLNMNSYNSLDLRDSCSFYPGGSSHECKTKTSSDPSSGMDRQIC